MEVKMIKFFVDTSFFIGLLNNRDKFHKLAVNKLKSLYKEKGNQLYTSDYVIAELSNFLVKTTDINNAINLIDEVINEEFCKIFYSNKQIIQYSLSVFRKERSETKPLNLTDCIVGVSNVLLKCDELLSFDERLKNYKIEIGRKIL